MKRSTIAACIIAAQFSGVAEAAPSAARRDVRVEHSDLNLQTAEGVAALQQRVNQAVVEACGTAFFLDAQQLQDVERCRFEARDRSLSALERLLSRKAARSAAVLAERE